MHGLIFVTWESYLTDRFGPNLHSKYCTMIGETWANAPMVTRIYDDAALLAGVGAASRLTHLPVDRLLREYGRYFILNGLTSRLCAYLLNQVHCAHDLLLIMNHAHKQISQTANTVNPPPFDYAAISGDPTGLRLRYDSPRHLCSLLMGAIEGAAERYGEQVQVSEQTCMKQGADACTFLIYFTRAPGNSGMPPQTPEQQERWAAQVQLAHLVYAVLPDTDGLTLFEVQERLRAGGAVGQQTRPFLILEALTHLHHAGWVTSTAFQTGENPNDHRYWRLLPVKD